MELIMAFASGVAVKYLIDYLKQLQDNKLVAGEEEICKSCIFKNTVMEMIENVEVTD